MSLSSLCDQYADSVHYMHAGENSPSASILQLYDPSVDYENSHKVFEIRRAPLSRSSSISFSSNENLSTPYMAIRTSDPDESQQPNAIQIDESSIMETESRKSWSQAARQRAHTLMLMNTSYCCVCSIAMCYMATKKSVLAVQSNVE
ncbi:uncharacterized protein LOC115622389 [Scaptodrosophila lebanonensis]|uniref:Uncharacterized protein LOC115622389 n=1 Tax=Drosophila lebanonensis TaxID=7225 RepID=A0A6J2TAP3_DROLE|nr:uncharacterized protein LOC115622389 [Scaptodrosophila lebanonensis]